MIADLDAMSAADPLAADVCIVGAGAAGITIAREFVGTPHSVILLEGGGEQQEKESQDPYASEVVGLPHAGVHDGRARVFGGTTTLWAGQVLPLFDVDFRHRPWVPESGWPIGPADLAPYYSRAEDVLQVPHRTYGPDTWPERAARPPAYDAGRFVGIYSQFCREPSFARKYGGLLRSASNVTVLTHANVTSLVTSADGRVVVEAHARSIGGASTVVRARHYIVCAGGIDSARLLLASDSVRPAGIGNDHDVVGRYFQDHPGVAAEEQPQHPHEVGLRLHGHHPRAQLPPRPHPAPDVRADVDPDVPGPEELPVERHHPPVPARDAVVHEQGARDPAGDQAHAGVRATVTRAAGSGRCARSRRPRRAG